MEIKDYMEAVNYRITEGSEFCWQCFGSDAHRLDSWNGQQDGYTVSIVFDTRTQVVYQTEACDYAHLRAYRWTNPEFKAAHDAEAVARNQNPLLAWEDDNGNDLNFVELDVEADFLDKALAIVQGTDYDTRVQVEIDLDDDLMSLAMRMAHEQDITLNQFMNNLLSGHLKTLENKHEH